jgi:AcrR family transcriptional regulator
MKTAKRQKALRIKQSPKLPAKERRNQLLKAAQALFIKRGYRTTTTEAIAHRAGLTKGALYFHFRSKEAIFSKLVQRAIDQFAVVFAPDVNRDLNPGDVLRLLCQIDASRSMPRTRHNLNLRAEAQRLPRVKAHVNKALREAIEVVAESLSSQYGRTKKQRRQLAVLIFAVYDGLTLGKQMSPDLIDFDEQIEAFASLFEGHKKTASSKRR